VESLPLIDQVQLGVQKLHAIEAQLMLFKLNDCAAVVDKYRLEVANIAAASSRMSGSNFDARVAECRNSVSAKRLEFFKLMGAAYS
jgi:hypothetical protein